jgi:hypothetical protein
MLRRAVYLAATAALYVAAAWAFDLPPFKPSPVYFRTVGGEGRVYACEGGVVPTISVRFDDDGRTAIVVVDGKAIRLDYTRSDFMSDRYESDGWTLVLDPEVSLVGPGGRLFGPCL